jgi:hypothetical protein
VVRALREAGQPRARVVGKRVLDALVRDRQFDEVPGEHGASLGELPRLGRGRWSLLARDQQRVRRRQSRASGGEPRSDRRSFAESAGDLDASMERVDAFAKLMSPVPETGRATSKPRQSSSTSRMLFPSRPRRRNTRQVVAPACRSTFESASRTSCTTSAAGEASSDAVRRRPRRP